MAKLSSEKYLVLMVDDSQDDCLLIKTAIGKADRLRFIGSVSDGEELVSYLAGKDDYGDRQRFPFRSFGMAAEPTLREYGGCGAFRFGTARGCHQGNESGRSLL